jgi:hypothetical protein
MTRKQSAYARKRARQAATVDPFAAFRALRSTAAAQSTADLDPDQLRDLRIGYHGALAALTSGTANDSDAHALALASNVSLLLCEHGIGREYLDDVIAAQQAVVSIKARRERVGRYGATGPELALLQTLLDLHDAQLDSEDCKEYVLIGALVECKRRAAAGHVLEVPA